ncbi:MAG: signal peptidase I [Spirochaetia bacterium]|jgi:signal peptidase I|nr:signal peptidase I [Spirochaetia bacterium]
MSKRSKLLGSYSSFKPQNKLKAKIGSFIKIIITFFLVYQFISFFIVTSFVVNTSAMEPGILKGDKILSVPLISGSYLNFLNLKVPGFKEPTRGDIVLIKPGNTNQLKWYYAILDPVIRFLTFQKITISSKSDQNWNNQLAVKRIIGIPGDSIKMIDYQFIIKPKDKTDYSLEENIIIKNYHLIIPQNKSGIDPSFPFLGTMEEITLTESQYLVANDNRSVSYDSRLYGPIPRENILGPVKITYWPDFSIY